MSHPVESTAEALIARLRQQSGEIPMPGNGQVFLPGLWGGFDTAEGELSGHLRAGEGALLRLSFSVQRPPRWCAVALALGDAGLAEGSVIGLVADLRADRPAHLDLVLRSVEEGRNRDIRFDDGFELSPEGGAQAALLAVPPGSTLTRPGQPLQLLLELPKTDIDIEIRDMRLFVLTAAEAGAAPAGLGTADPAEVVPG